MDWKKVDTYKEGLNETKYIYAFCKCPNPLNIVWRAEKPADPGWYKHFCPECKTEFGVITSGTKNDRSLVKK